MPAKLRRDGSMPCSKGDPDVARWSTYVGRGAIRFYLPLNVQLPNNFFAQAVIVAKDVAARERLRIKLEKVLANEFPSVVAGSPRLSSAARRMAGAVPRQRSRCAQVREIALKLAQIVGNKPAGRARQFRLDRAGAGGRIRSTRTRRACSA